MIEVVFVAIVALITLLALHGTKKRSLLVGIICDIFNVIMYASPLTIMVSTFHYISIIFIYLPITLYLKIIKFISSTGKGDKNKEC